MNKQSSDMRDMLASIRRAIHEEAAHQAVGLHAAGREEGDSPRWRRRDADAPPLRGSATDDGDDEPGAALEEGAGETGASHPVAEGAAEGPGAGARRRGWRRAGVIGGIMGGRIGAGEAHARLGLGGVSAAAAAEEGAQAPEEESPALSEDDGGSWWPETEEDFLQPDNDLSARAEDGADLAFVADAWGPGRGAGAPEPPVAAAAEAAVAAAPATETAAAAELAVAAEDARDSTKEEGRLLSPGSAAAAAAAFARLKQELGCEGAETLESLLRPMLREWLDAHLPELVERLVREEISRIAHGGSRR